MTSIPTNMGVALLTKEGGSAFPSINGTGVTSITGTLVSQSSSADDTFVATPAGTSGFIGVVYNAVSNGEAAWIVHSGRAQFLLESGTGCISGETLSVSSTEDGRAVAGSDSNLVGIATETVTAPGIGECALVMSIVSSKQIRIISLGEGEFSGYFPGGWT